MTLDLKPLLTRLDAGIRAQNVLSEQGERERHSLLTFCDTTLPDDARSEAMRELLHSSDAGASLALDLVKLICACATPSPTKH